MLAINAPFGNTKRGVQVAVTGNDTKPIVEAIASGLKVVAIATAFRILTR
jgi:hypothetical protein